MLEDLYKEFGEEIVHIVRRELTAKNSKMPSYIELVAELYLRQGPDNKEIRPDAECNHDWQHRPLKPGGFFVCSKCDETRR